MLDTTVHKTENHNLAIASRRQYERKIDRLESDLRRACTPDQLEKAETIVEEFRQKLIFKYISADNSLINATVWKSNQLHNKFYISFVLNGKQITISVPDLDLIIKTGKSQANTVTNIKEKICRAVTKELAPHILLKIIDAAFEHERSVV